MKRYATVIGLSERQKAQYKELHANAWPKVLERITACNIRNYSIFLREPENLMFGYFEYHGDDFDADMAKMAADPVTQEWWAVCKPCQEPLKTRAEGEWWAAMEEVFHHD